MAMTNYTNEKNNALAIELGLSVIEPRDTLGLVRRAGGGRQAVEQTALKLIRTTKTESGLRCRIYESPHPAPVKQVTANYRNSS